MRGRIYIRHKTAKVAVPKFPVPSSPVPRTQFPYPSSRTPVPVSQFPGNFSVIGGEEQGIRVPPRADNSATVVLLCLQFNGTASF